MKNYRSKKTTLKQCVNAIFLESNQTIVKQKARDRTIANDRQIDNIERFIDPWAIIDIDSHV